MRHVIDVLADKGSVFEMKPAWGKSVITALGRLNGQTVGFLGNNPMHMEALRTRMVVPRQQDFSYIAIPLIFRS